MFKFFRARRAEKQIAYTLYKTLVEQARRAPFYTEFGVDDTIEGRFDMILLHLFLVDDRLDQAGEAYMGLRRNLHEAMVTDLDRSFREIGVGDMSVGKEMKKVGDAWLGRHTAYAAAFAPDADDQLLLDSLSKNVYAGQVDKPVKSMGIYTRKAKKLLELTDLETIIAGTLVFPSPDVADQNTNKSKKAVS